MQKPVLYIVIPCYNEQEVLPITAPMFLKKLTQLCDDGLISDDSRIMFVNDGSSDGTWELIRALSEENEHYIGISQSRNRGHQNAAGRADGSQGSLRYKHLHRLRRAGRH